MSRLRLEKDIVTEGKAKRNGQFMALKGEEQGHEEKSAGGLKTRPDSPGESGMQPRDPCRPWRGTLDPGHKPRYWVRAWHSHVGDGG